jgi:hypothetical protein
VPTDRRNHHQQSSNGRTVGVPIQSKHSPRLYHYPRKIRIRFHTRKPIKGRGIIKIKKREKMRKKYREQ